MIQYNPRHHNATKAIHNWEKKSAYLLRENVKFRTYIDALTFADAQKGVIYGERAEREKEKEEREAKKRARLEAEARARGEVGGDGEAGIGAGTGPGTATELDSVEIGGPAAVVEKKVSIEA